jgi:starch phosphorylase
MAFQIQPLQEFLVRPAVPEALSRMPELAYNIVWSWEPVIRAVFRRLDPALWKDCLYNPVAMLGRVSQQTLEKAAADPRYMAQYGTACKRFDAHMQRPAPEAGGKLVAYFSAEYGLTECMPIYSGGLGILSGDHLKSSSDCSIPLVAVGLLYQRGYFRQLLNPDGWQQERNPDNDFYSLPIKPATDPDGNEVKVQVTLPSGCLTIKVWVLQVAQVKLYLLDTNVPENALQEDRAITDQLYGGDTDTRIRQEIVLGIGGMRALRALKLEPTAYHMNEGHSAFLAIERIRLFIEDQKLTFAEALEATRANNVFTTHTPVPAGIDLFDAGQFYHYFQQYCRDANIDYDQLLALGRSNPHDQGERFSMAILALNASAYRNAVSVLHREVSQGMWNGLWPQLPVTETPITSVTNGVHLPSWLNGDLADLYDQYLQPDWRERFNDPECWALVKEIPDEEIFEAHKRRKRRLISFLRERQMDSAVRRKAAASELRYASEVFDPNALTIGFARRFATYKRATLLFRDVERLKRILRNPERPVQILIAGKAHPKDTPGKTFIREIVQLSRDPELWKHVVFVEDYDMKVAREMVQGVDVWLNNPRRGEEACGTSGMKAAMNGVLNLSVLDGWFDEAYEHSGGWAIGDREPYSEDQDALHASAIYYLIENEIVPMFYERKGQGMSNEWMRRVKESMQFISPGFDARRMVTDYDQQLYTPAHDAFTAMKKAGFEPARQRTMWNQKVREVWDRVRFVPLEGEAQIGQIISGHAINLRAAVDMAGLDPADVRVEAVLGRIGTNGSLEEMEVLVLPPTVTNGTVTIFGREITPTHTGRLGYSVRVSPNHYEDPLTRPVTSLLKWSGR